MRGVFTQSAGCVKTRLRRMRRIVFSIAFFRKRLPVQSPTSTKSRWKFYAQVTYISSMGSARLASGFHKCPHRGRHFVVFHKAPPQLIGNIFGDVAGPALGGVEGDDACRIAILAAHEMLDQHLAEGHLLVGLPPGTAPATAKIVQYQICPGWIPAARSEGTYYPYDATRY